MLQIHSMSNPLNDPEIAKRCASNASEKTHMIQATFYIGLETSVRSFAGYLEPFVRRVRKLMRREEWYPFLDEEVHEYRVKSDEDWHVEIRKKLALLGREFVHTIFRVVAVEDGVVTTYRLQGSDVSLIHEYHRSVSRDVDGVVYRISAAIEGVHNSLSKFLSREPRFNGRFLNSNLYYIYDEGFIVRSVEKDVWEVIGVLRERESLRVFRESLKSEERIIARFLDCKISPPLPQELETLRSLGIHIRETRQEEPPRITGA